MKEEWTLSVSPATALVSASQTGPFKASTVYQVLKRTAKGGGVPGRSNPHSLHNGFGRDSVLSGGDISALADIMGHWDWRLRGFSYGFVRGNCRSCTGVTARWETETLDQLIEVRILVSQQ